MVNWSNVGIGIYVIIAGIISVVVAAVGGSSGISDSTETSIFALLFWGGLCVIAIGGISLIFSGSGGSKKNRT